MTSNPNLRFAKYRLTSALAASRPWFRNVDQIWLKPKCHTTPLRVGFRHLDCAERIGMSARWASHWRGVRHARIAREEVFITTKLWNTNHRPERVRTAFAASCARLGISIWIFT